jgi:tetratricopeptide (TPR) repeat protein
MTPEDTVFISYAHESEDFREQVKVLVDWLAARGINVVSDHKYGSRPPRLGWKAWMQQEIEDATVVLIVCSPKYKARFEKREVPGQGKGVTWEGAIVTQDLYDASLQNDKFYPILPDDGDYDNIPKVLRDFFNNHRFPSGDEGILALIHEVLEGRAASGAALGGIHSFVADTAVNTPASSSALAAISNVPHRRNPNFTGREELLAALEARLKSGNAAALTQALAGLGGVGKTQTALEYVYRHAAAFDVVWWIRSEEGATLAADYAALAHPLQLPERDAQDQGQIVAVVRHWLEKHTGWLLIFDNAEAQTDLDDYLPRSTEGQIIITSRNPVFGGVAESLAVAKWEREESKAFLAKRTKRTDPDGADAIAAELGDLPLALAQAAAYMEETGESYAGYLKLFRERRKAIWAHEEAPREHPESVEITWVLSMEKAAAAAGAAALMNLCAFFAPDDIAREMLRDHRDQVPEPLQTLLGDTLALNAVLAALRKYSLLEVREDALDIHRLVQAVVRDRLDEEARKTWCEAATCVVNAAYPGNSVLDVASWPICGRLTPHVRLVALYAETLGVAQDAAVRLLNQAGLYLKGRAEFDEAQTFYERALKIAEAAYGPDHPHVATTVNNLGGLLQDLGDLAGARKHCERALRIAEAAFEPDRPKVATYLNNLGMVLQDLGDLTEARAHFERALRIFEQHLGPDHPNVATPVNNLGGVLWDLGDLAGAGARTHFERALRIGEANLGPDHPDMAIRVNNLGFVLQELGDLSEARAHFERALRIFEQHLGPDHPEVATLVNNLGSVLWDLGDPAGARAHFEKALRIDEAAYGQDHPDVARDVNNLGSMLHALGDLTSARAHFERALRIDEAAYGPDHPSVAMDVNNLGSVLRELGDLAGARAHFERALAIFRRFLGDDHPKTKSVERKLAALGEGRG